MSWDTALHGAGFGVAFTPVTAACFVFARRFAALDRRRWAVGSTALGIAAPLLADADLARQVTSGPAFAAAGLVAS